MYSIKILQIPWCRSEESIYVDIILVAVHQNRKKGNRGIITEVGKVVLAPSLLFLLWYESYLLVFWSYKWHLLWLIPQVTHRSQWYTSTPISSYHLWYKKSTQTLFTQIQSYAQEQKFAEQQGPKRQVIQYFPPTTGHTTVTHHNDILLSWCCFAPQICSTKNCMCNTLKTQTNNLSLYTEMFTQLLQVHSPHPACFA